MLPTTYAYCFSETGYMNEKLWVEILDAFSTIWRQRNPGRNATVLVDNLEIHHSVEPIIKAKKNGVYLFFLPPNTSHFLQPLDNLVFAIYKTQLAILANQLLAIVNKDHKLSPLEIITAVTRKAEAYAFAPEKIKASFANCHIWPLDCDAILEAAKINVGLISSKERSPKDRTPQEEKRLNAQEVATQAYIRRSGRKEEVAQSHLAVVTRISATSKYETLIHSDAIIDNSKKLAQEKDDEKRRKEAVIVEKTEKKAERARVAAEKRAAKELKAAEKLSSGPKKAAKRKRASPIFRCQNCTREWNQVDIWNWCQLCGEYGHCPECKEEGGELLVEHLDECKAPKRKRARKDLNK